MTCCSQKREIFFLVRGLVVCSRGELGWGRRRRNREGEGRQSGHLLTFTDGLTNGIIPSVSPSAILMVNRACHCTKILVWIPRWFLWHFKRWIGHVTVRSCRFEFLDDSVCKITLKNLHVNKPPFFILNNSSVILSGNTDRMCPSVYIGGKMNGKNFVNNCDLKISIEVFYR